jgi:hypothetical protein
LKDLRFFIYFPINFNKLRENIHWFFDVERFSWLISLMIF